MEGGGGGSLPSNASPCTKQKLCKSTLLSRFFVLTFDFVQVFFLVKPSSALLASRTLTRLLISSQRCPLLEKGLINQFFKGQALSPTNNGLNCTRLTILVGAVKISSFSARLKIPLSLKTLTSSWTTSRKANSYMLEMQLRIEYPLQVDAVILFPVKVVVFASRWCIDFDVTTINCSHNSWGTLLQSHSLLLELRQPCQ